VAKPLLLSFLPLARERGGGEERERERERGEREERKRLRECV